MTPSFTIYRCYLFLHWVPIARSKGEFQYLIWNMGSYTLKAPLLNAEWRISVSELYQNLYMYFYLLVLIWYSPFKFWYAWTLEKTEGTVKNWLSRNIGNIYFWLCKIHVKALHKFFILKKIITLTPCFTLPHYCAYLNQDLNFHIICRGIYYLQCFEVRKFFPFCWYCWNCWPLLFDLSLYNIINFMSPIIVFKQFIQSPYEYSGSSTSSFNVNN